MGTGWYPRRLTADENERLVLPVSFVSFCFPATAVSRHWERRSLLFIVGGTLPATTVG